MGKGARERREREKDARDFSLSPAQMKVMRREINAQILKKDDLYWQDVDAAVMWTLHKTFGFGKKRLRRFYEALADIHTGLRQRYELDDDGNMWLYRQMLQDETGVDVAEWEKEIEKQHDNSRVGK